MSEAEFIEAIESCKSQDELDTICIKHVKIWFDNEELCRRIFKVRCRILNVKKPK